MSASTFVFALVLVAAVSAVPALIISVRHMLELASLRSTMRSDLQAHWKRIGAVDDRLRAMKSTATPELLAEVAALSDAVQRLADTQRRFQGRFDARMGREEARSVPSNGHARADDDVQAMLALQSAPPGGP